MQREWGVRHPDALVLDALKMPFSDILGSCDLLLTKPGYGSFTEAAGQGIPVLFLPRPGWPEAPCLERWLMENGRAEALSPAPGALAAAVERLLLRGRYRPVAAGGIEPAVTAIEQMLLSTSI